MVGWGTEPDGIENPQKVASSEGEELYVGMFPLLSSYANPSVRKFPTKFCLEKKLLEKSELLKGLMQGTLPPTLYVSCGTYFADVQDDKGPIPLNNVAMNVLKKVVCPIFIHFISGPDVYIGS